EPSSGGRAELRVPTLSPGVTDILNHVPDRPRISSPTCLISHGYPHPRACGNQEGLDERVPDVSSKRSERNAASQIRSPGLCDEFARPLGVRNQRISAGWGRRCPGGVRKPGAAESHGFKEVRKK